MIQLVLAMLIAQTTWAADPLVELEAAESNIRMGAAIGSSVIGVSLIVVPQFADSLSDSSKILFSLGGISVLANGLKNFFVPTQTERMIGSYRLLRENPNLKKEDRKQYEDALFRDAAAFSRANRHWQSGISFVGGAGLILGGLAQDAGFSRTFLLVSGGSWLIGGVLGLFKETPAEEISRRYFDPGFAVTPSGPAFALTATF